MCCQPPQKDDDFNFCFNQNIKLIKSAPKETKVVCITGGEPTLAGDSFIELVSLVRKELPLTDIHVLSNGRAFSDNEFVHKLKVAGEDKVFIGVPLHSDFFRDHDIISGAKGAFNETMLGIYNLANEGILIELRIVINKLNYYRLPQLAKYIFKNLYFVSWVAFMGMEDTGWASKNAETIWVEPIDYASQLCRAVKELDDWDIPVAIYNIPLCLLPTEYHRFATRSISDWKTRYLDICNDCSVRFECCGLFGTSMRNYQGLKAI
jgi:His-Xaa-Ser system radical SAM maturase HxsC